MKQFNLMTQAKADILYVLHQSLHLMYTKLRSHGTLGKDNLKRNIVPPSVDSSMKKFSLLMIQIWSLINTHIVIYINTQSKRMWPVWHY